MYQLNPALKEFWITKSRYKALYGGRASSKCLAVGTKVMMFDGSIKAVEDVKVGDQVRGPDLIPRTVTSTTTGKSELFRIRQSSAADYVVNKDHILSVKRVKSSYQGKRLADGSISPRHPHLGRVHNINVVDYANSSAKFKANFVGYKSGLMPFPERKVLLDPYILGIWLGDGDGDNAIITTEDHEIVTAMKEFAEREGMVTYECKWNGSSARSYRITEKDRHKDGLQGSVSNRILSALKSYGILTTFAYLGGKKTRHKAIKRIPFDYISNSEEIRLQLLAGIIDTDGTYSRSKGSMIFSSASELFAMDVKHLIDTLGFKSSILKVKTTAQNGFEGQAWVVSFSGRLHEIPCRIARKKAEKYDKVKDELLTYIEVIPEGTGEYAGFSVDGDHLFCLEDGTVTHNSHDAAGFAVFLAANYKVRFMCARQFQNRISESVYNLIKDKIENSEFNGEFDLTNNSIVHKETGSEFIFYGIARNLSEIKSTEGVDILWLEEANYLTEEQWQVIEPTIRKEGSQIWLIWNPDEYMDFVYQNFVVNPPKDCLKREINWPENPFLSTTMLEVIADAYVRDKKAAEHVYGGQPKMGGDKSVISLAYILAAIDAHKKLGWEPVGKRTVGFDVADDGGDKNAIVDVHGNVIIGIDEWEGLEDQLLKSCSKVYNYALEAGASIIWDSIGVGASAGSKFGELNDAKKMQVQYEAFNAGGSVDDPDGTYMKLPHITIKNKDHFANIKAQKWDEVATRFRKTYENVEQGAKHPIDELISIDSDKVPAKFLEKLKMELSQPRKDVDGNGRFKVESKKDMLARKIRSPNIADAVIMALIKPKRSASGFFD